MKRPWKDFLGITSPNPQAQNISPDDLCDMDTWRKAERIAACNGHDPLRTLVAYAQDELTYADGEPVNFFGLSYRRDAKLYLHKTLANITIAAAIHLYNTHQWDTVLYDGLRTVEGAYNLYLHASEETMQSGLLSLPGTSAHNKGMAVDSMMMDRNGNEVDMGGHFDHPDMESNSRLYTGNKISDAAKKNRMIRETAFMRGALMQGLLIAPLRPEFWDDRLPEGTEDLWRVLDSAARCLGISLLSQDDEDLRKTNRTAFSKKWESWNYKDFLMQWEICFKGQEERVHAILGVTTPPPAEKFEFYHGNYHPIYDSTLRTSGKHLTEVQDAA